MAYGKKLVISVNWKRAKELGKETFLKQHKGFSEDHLKQLSEMFDEKFGKPKAEKSEDKK